MFSFHFCQESPSESDDKTSASFCLGELFNKSSFWWKMDSRRTASRSSLGNGRTTNGTNGNGNDRPGGCSYLSNVRPETRSTLCSVIAQLTEETQPSFETTLKSKAVSENCSVKFSCVVTGHPAPQVTWYKDDMQLDRYCGLPKYEIFRNGQNHSLYIYNCTVDDAAIYQASAINCKGIVSCSGVLEVGDMNEFKIHQRYFAKLKQKAEHKRKEAEGKENQEPLRTISPDRSQRKRRSTSEAFLSTPSSLEDEDGGESRQDSAAETESRLQEAAGEEVQQEPVPVTNGVASALTNGQAIEDGAGESATHDSTQKIPTIHQAKSSFVKKKIKISSNAKFARGDKSKERVSTDKRSKDEVSASVASPCTETGQPKWSPEEAMEVQNNVYSTVVNSDSKALTKEHQKPSTQEKTFSRRSLKGESTSPGATVSLKKERRLSASVSPASVRSTRHAVPGAEEKQAAAPENKSGRKEAKDSFETQSPIRRIAPKQPQPGASSPLVSTVKKHIHAKEQVTVPGVDVKLKASSGGPAAHRDSESVDKSHDSRATLPQRSNTPSAKQTTPHQKKAPVSRPAPPGEVMQAHAKMSRNDARVSLEIPTDRHMMASRELQETPTEKRIHRRDTNTSSLHSSLQDTSDKKKVDMLVKARDSKERHTGLLTRLPKPTPQSPIGGAGNTQECDVLPKVRQSQVDTAIKSDKGPEIRDSEKVEDKGVGKLFAQADSVAPNEKVIEMEVEPVKVHVAEHTRAKRTKDEGEGGGDLLRVDERSKKETDKNELPPEAVEKTNPQIETPKSDAVETPHLQPKPPGGADSLDHVNDFQEVPQPATRVISVAELLRSQIKALESSLLNSESIKPANCNLEPDPSATAAEPRQDLRDAERKSRLEVKKPRPDRKPEKSLDDPPPTTIKATLMEVYNQLNKVDQDQNETPSCVRVLQEPMVVPLISVVDSGLTAGTTGSYTQAKQYNDDIMDIGQETEALLILPKDSSVKQSSPLLLSKEDKLNTSQIISNQPETVSHKSASPITVTQTQTGIQESNVVSGHPEEQLIPGKGIESTENNTEGQKLNSKPEEMLTEINLTSNSDQNKVEERPVVSGFVQNALMLPTESDFSAGKQENNHVVQLDSEQVKSDSLTNQTPEPSPLLKRRNCASPIPSATPQELASGARRKILTPKVKPEELLEAANQGDNQILRKEASPQSSKISTSPAVTSAVTSAATSPVTSAVTSAATSPVTSAVTSAATSPVTSAVTSAATSPVTSAVTSAATSPVTSPVTSAATSPVTSPMTSAATYPVTSAATSPVTSAVTSAATSAVTSAATSPVTSAATSPVTSAVTSAATSPVTSPMTSAVTSAATSPVTSPMTSAVTSAVSSTATSPVTSPVTSTVSSTATSPVTSAVTSTATSATTSPVTSTASSAATSPVTSTATSAATSPVTSTATSPVTSTGTSVVTSPVTSAVTSPVTSPVTSAVSSTATSAASPVTSPVSSTVTSAASPVTSPATSAGTSAATSAVTSAVTSATTSAATSPVTSTATSAGTSAATSAVTSAVTSPVTSAATSAVSPSLSRGSPLLQPATGEQSSHVERRSPLVRRKTTPEAQTPSPSQPDEGQTERKPAEKDKHNPFKAPQVIRKIRGENFADSSGHLKLWCQFFNVLSDSTITWYKNEEELARMRRTAGDETPVNLAIVQASCKDSGVYGCSITNEYGTDSTDILLSTDILAGMSLREDLGVGEEIEMVPLIFTKGVADSGAWGNKFFGRIMMRESHIGDGCSHKVWRANVIYGLEPVFESGNTCIIKVRNPIAYGGKQESFLVEKNLETVKQECKMQNLAREYCKIFSAEARVLENFGSCLEVIPVYMMYRPANTVPYATVETDLTGVYQKYSALDHTGRIHIRAGSDVEQKCSALQHWIFQWTNGNLLFTRLEGVDTKITNVGISVKSTGHQGLPVEGNPRVFENFISQHKCNYFCGLLGLRSLKVMDSLMTPSKPKGSRSPLLQRKLGTGSSSPQTGRRAAGSPRLPKKAEQDGNKTAGTQKEADAPKEVEAL